MLPNVFSMEDEGIKYSVRYDTMSVQEKFQIRSDICKAYEVFKQNFSVNNIEKTLNLEIHVFNNRNDYIKYNGLSGIDADNTYGATNNETIIVYKFAGMDFVLGHELGHAFQHQLATGIDKALNGELIGNYIGAQVEEANKKHIEEGNIKEYTAEEHEKTAHYNQLENEKDPEEQDIKKEMQNDAFKSEGSEDSMAGLPGVILSFFNNFISWIFGIEEENKSSELPQNPLPSDSINHHLDEDNHYSSMSDLI